MKSSHARAASTSRGSEASEVTKRRVRSTARPASPVPRPGCRLGFRRQRASLLDQRRETLRQASLDESEVSNISAGDQRPGAGRAPRCSGATSW